MQCRVVQSSPVRCSILPCTAVQLSVVRCRLMQCRFVQCSAVQYSGDSEVPTSTQYMSQIPTRRGNHFLPFLKQGRFKTVSWIEGVGFMSRHQLLHWLKNHTQLEIQRFQRFVANSYIYFSSGVQSICCCCLVKLKENK